MTAPAIRLVATDLDGTLLDRRYRVSPANHAAVQDLREAGIAVVPATGRRFGAGAPYGLSLGLRGPMIFQNGALAKNLGDRVPLFWRAMSPALVRHVVSAGRRFGILPLLIGDPFGPGTILLEEAPHQYGRLGRYLESSWTDVQMVGDLGAVRRGDILQVSFCGNVQPLRELAGILRRETGADASITGTEYPERDLSLLDLMHPAVTKGTALARLAGLLGVPPEATAAFGDNFNDREMLAAVGLPLVMGNADESLRAEFPRIVPPCDASGVAWGIWTHILPRPDRLREWNLNAERPTSNAER
jgi:Cof subfamily protein (haloacid dehalogenase superfamily)